MAKEGTFEHPPRGHVAVIGYDSVNDRFQVAYVDASGHVQVDLAAVTDGLIRLYGYDGSSWQRLGLLFSYNDALGDHQTLTSAAGGTETLTHPTVPADELWVVTAWTAFCDTANPSQVRGRLYDGASTRQYWRSPTVTANQAIALPTPLYLKPTMYLSVQYTGCNAGDVIRSTIAGYKMVLAMT